MGTQRRAYSRTGSTRIDRVTRSGISGSRARDTRSEIVCIRMIWCHCSSSSSLPPPTTSAIALRTCRGERRTACPSPNSLGGATSVLERIPCSPIPSLEPFQWSTPAVYSPHRRTPPCLDFAGKKWEFPLIGPGRLKPAASGIATSFAERGCGSSGGPHGQAWSGPLRVPCGVPLRCTSTEPK